MDQKQLIIDTFIHKINSNIYLKNDKLPSERELVKSFNTSRYTVRKALAKLEKIGYIRKVQGSGIFVTDIDHFDNLVYNSMTEIKRKDIVSLLNYLKKRAPTKEEALLFDITENDFVWDFQRIRIAEYKMNQIENTIIPCCLFPNLNKDNIISSLHKYVEECGYEIYYFATEYSSVPIDLAQSKILGVKKGLPAMKIKNKGYLLDHRLFEISESINIDYTCSYIRKYNKKQESMRDISRY